MSSNENNKNNLHKLVPYGLIVTRAWLMEKGIPRHTLDNLVKRQELESIVHGIYKRPETNLTWKGVVTSLQYMGSNLVVGGISSLEIQGLSHYLPLSKKRVIHLYGYNPLPRWVKKLRLEEIFQWHGNSRLWAKTQEADPGKKFTVKLPWMEETQILEVSSPERAICEVLADVPEKVSFDHAEQLMQGLSTLSPNRLQKLLQCLKHVKAKRLFFWLAESQNHAWFKKIDSENIDLGSGKRVLARGGKLNKKYQITVPAEMHG